MKESNGEVLMTEEAETEAENDKKAYSREEDRQKARWGRGGGDGGEKTKERQEECKGLKNQKDKERVSYRG